MHLAAITARCTVPAARRAPPRRRGTAPGAPRDIRPTLRADIPPTPGRTPPSRDTPAPSVAGMDTDTSTTDTSTTPDPADLLAAVAAGRPGAWAELITRYTPLLRARTARYRLQEADAHDAVQITWLRLAENVHRIHTPAHLGGWLATVVARECQRIGRERGRLVPVEDAGEDDAATAPGPEERALDADTAGRVRAAVAALPPRRRALVEALFAGDGRGYAQIAADLGMPIGSLGPTRARTLRELRVVLADAAPEAVAR